MALPLATRSLHCASVSPSFNWKWGSSANFWQLSYTHQMKSKTEYVKPTFLKQIKTETANFKNFKKLTQRWADLSLALSKENIRTARENNLT